MKIMDLRHVNDLNDCRNEISSHIKRLENLIVRGSVLDYIPDDVLKYVDQKKTAELLLPLLKHELEIREKSLVELGVIL